MPLVVLTIHGIGLSKKHAHLGHTSTDLKFVYSLLMKKKEII